jgi:hypothetical protein
VRVVRAANASAAVIVFVVGDVVCPGEDPAAFIGFWHGDVDMKGSGLVPCQCSSPSSM